MLLLADGEIAGKDKLFPSFEVLFELNVLSLSGGATFAVMVSLYASLRSDGLSQHSAWRAAFAIVPCVILATFHVCVAN